MSKLRKLIDQITEFGINPKVETSDKIDVLKKLLVEIYSEYLNVEFEFDNKEYDEEPEFDYAKIRQNVKSNFPEFDWYSMVLDLNEMKPNVEIGIGDALDDLTDIIKDLLAVKWKMDNTSDMDALWEFDFSMRAHSEQHLINLLKFIKEKE
ncbi:MULTISPECIES: DUF5063 domain-containing protein [unclassified Flavobacterium]|uniref:DUF5063 domain-containing protein n=1 Tax=unclassified Flavobacterium TaxID=196869 RepID=UPI001290DCA3|nr:MULTISPECIES: DUF5063 domain-containing protein [unclassified Flavobacterium]MQP53723.1 DUF5063 domain-containing protein [Flavobacterium sp. LMO9]MQP63634.1 DUF5063 domain-containing protein [Flavobacterium sp. LMO6]